MSHKKDSKPLLAISVNPVHGIPHSSFDMINKYGTYQVQDTANTPNEYPTISQGLAKRDKAIRENQRT